MSVETMQEVRRHSRADGSARSVINALAFFASRDSLAWPSNQELENQSGLKERKVRYALRKLERMGEIRRRPDLESWRRRRVYQIDPREGHQMSLLEPETGAPGAGSRGHVVPGARGAGARGAETAAPTRARGRNDMNQLLNCAPPDPPAGGERMQDQTSEDVPANDPTPRAPARSVRAAAARRRPRRRRRNSASASEQSCPLSEATATEADRDALTSATLMLLERLRELAEPDPYARRQWEIWGFGAHVHAVGDRLELALPAAAVGYLSRFSPALLKLLQEAAGRPVVLVPCSAADRRAVPA